MRIGFLATGTELVVGEIQNSSTPHISQLLTEAGIEVGIHLMCGDDRPLLIQSLEFLIQHHDWIIVTGGLGPTTDDHTRWFISEACQQPLQTNAFSLERLYAGLKQVNRAPTPEQETQALFPQNAEVLPNRNGWADGFLMHLPNDKAIVALPGPPFECLPMFEQYILPLLKERLQNPHRWLRWRLLGARESTVAPQLEPIVQFHGLIAGYRIDYPYLHLKIRVPADMDTSVLIEQINEQFKEYLWIPQHQPASQVLKEFMTTGQFQLFIEDQATHDALKTVLFTPETQQYVHFGTHPTSSSAHPIHVRITGLDHYWNGEQHAAHQITIEDLNAPYEIDTYSFQVLTYSPIPYAIEWICGQLWRRLHRS